MSRRDKIVKRTSERTGWAGSLPGKLQLVKSTSSIAMYPGISKVLEASNRMVKSWGILPIVTSPCCHESPWLPDNHHSLVVLDPSFSSTFSSSASVDWLLQRLEYIFWIVLFIYLFICWRHRSYKHTLPIHVVEEVQYAGGAGLFHKGTLEGSRAHLITLVRFHCHVPTWKHQIRTYLKLLIVYTYLSVKLHKHKCC